jgi:hypothetical protein
MGVIYKTTLVPSKLELLAAWLPSQPWYRGAAGPELSRAGGFRLDDPAGEVGIELMVVNDASGPAPVSYLTPLTYRGAPLSGGESHLVGTTEHGVLGRRWVYDGVQDPVFVAEVLAFICGDVVAQAQSESDTVDPTVSRELSVTGQFVTSESVHVDSDTAGTDVRGITLSSRPVEVHVVRALRATADGPHRAGSLGEIVASWTALDGSPRRGPFVLVVALTPDETLFEGERGECRRP